MRSPPPSARAQSFARLPRLAAAVLVALMAVEQPAIALALAPAPSEGEDATAEPSAAAIAAGAAAVEAEEYDQAIEHYLRAKSLDAEADVAKPLAMAYFESGQQSYVGGDYDHALERFQDAQGLFPSPKFHYNIAQCYEALERPREAVDSYRAFLRGVPDTPDRVNLQNRIDRLSKQIEDDERAGAEAEPSAPEGPIAQPATTTDEPRRRAKPVIIAGAVVTGVGAALALGGGLGFGLRARDREQRVNDVFQNGNPEGLTRAEAEKLDEEGRQASTNQIITLAVGGAVAAVGVALLTIGLLERKRQRKLALQPRAGLTEAGLSLVGRF